MATSHALLFSPAGQVAGRERLGKCQATPLLAKPTGESSHNGTYSLDVDTRRTRKSHKKVRTGCLTCKVRRKKCDETRPACNRCTSTGRRCDGYDIAIDQFNNALSGHTDHVIEPRRSTVLEATIVALPLSLTENPIINGNVQDVCDTSAPHNTSAVTSRPHSDCSTPISEALEDAEIEAFISGYMNGEESASENSSQQIILPAQQHCFKVSRAPNMLPACTKLSDLELHCFSQFRFRTGPQFASYFDSQFWRRHCTLFALSHPVVFAAATALGAVHQRYMYGISREAFEYCGHAHRLKLKAQKMLNQFRVEYENNLLQSRSGFNTGLHVHDRDIIMASEMLLGLFEGFQGDHETSLAHMKRGLSHMLHRPMRLIYSETVSDPTETTFSSFVTLIGRIKDSVSELSDTPIRILANRASDVTMPDVPHSFQSVDEGRDYMFTEAEWILSTPIYIWNDEDARAAAQRSHVMRILRWNVAYANTTSNMERTARQKECCVLLKLLRIALYFLLYLMTDKDLCLEAQLSDLVRGKTLNASTTEPAFAQTALWDAVAARDEVFSNFARIRLLAESIIDDKNVFHYIEHSVEFDSAIGPPKADKQLVESSSKLKHLIKILSGKLIDDASLWERLGVYCVAERLSAIEEHAVFEATRLLIPPSIEPKWVDVTCMLEEKKVLLRYCHEDQDAKGTIWIQQWWEF